MKTTIAAIALVSGFVLHSAFATEWKDPVVTLTMPRGTTFSSMMKILDALKAVGVESVGTRNISTAEPKEPSVFVSIDRNASYPSVVKILDACKAAGVNNISLKATSAEETNK